MPGLFHAPEERDQSLGRAPLFAAPAQAARPQTSTDQRRLSRRPRHSGLFEAVHRLDTQIDEAGRRELTRWIADQYATEYGDIPLGLFARCYLGPPFVDHRLDLFHSIVEHYQPDDAVPAPFDRARMLARLGS